MKADSSDVSYMSEYADLILSKNKTEVRKIIEVGLEKQSSYKPLIEVREKLENP
jgi:hypothetical protein